MTANTAYVSVSETPRPVVYLPMLSRWRWGTILHVRVSGDPQAAAALVVDAIHAQNPELPVFNVTTLRASVAFATIFERLAATFVGAFGAIALALATLGIYGVIACSTRRRTQEIAIRMAMGADAADVVRLVMTRGLRLTLLGLAFGSVVLLLAAVALAASYLPARRATRVEPSAALRQS